MSEPISNIETLIAKSISGNISEKELNELEKWKSDSVYNIKKYNKSLKIWRKSSDYLSVEDINDDLHKINKQINNQLQIKLHRISRLNLFYKLAAIFTIPIAIAFSWYYVQFEHKSPNKKQYTEITSPYGNVSKCILPDGTEVWINTSSTISYDASNFAKKTREVQLNGEAYFLVEKDNEIPFKVNTRLGCVCVTGTAFNVKAYSDSKTFETVLKEGSVFLNLYSNGQQTFNLTPGERIVYNSENNTIKITEVDPEILSSWRNGEIIFKDATLNDLIKELERIYDIRFYLDDKKLGEYRFRGMFAYNNNLIDALEKIKKTTELEYYIENKEVRLTKK